MIATHLKNENYEAASRKFAILPTHFSPKNLNKDRIRTEIFDFSEF